MLVENKDHKILKQLIKKFEQHRLLTLSAALAFYTTLSIGPFLMIAFFILSYLRLDIQTQFLLDIHHQFGEGVANILRRVIDSFHKQTPHINTLAGIFAVFTLLFSSSAAFVELRGSLSMILGNKAKVIDESSDKLSQSFVTAIQEFLINRFFSIVMVFIFIFFSTASIVLSSLLNTFFKGNYLLLDTLFSLGLFSLIFYTIFRYLPKKKVEHKSTLLGAVITGIFFVFGKGVVAKLASSILMVSAYGTAGSLIILIAWFYYASVILYVGAEVVNVHSQRYKE